MRILSIFLVLLLLTGSSLAALTPLNKDVNTPIKSDVSGSSNRLGWVSIQTIPAAESTDDDQIFNATAGHLNLTTKLIITSSGNHSSYFLAQPDVPRNIIGTVNASTSLSVRINGTDISGAAISENLTWSSASGAKATTRAFKTVDRVDATLAAGQTNKTLKLGTGDLLGLNTKLTTNTVLLAALNDTKEGTAPAVTVNSTVLSLNTIDTSGAPAGKVTKVWFVV